MRFSTTRVFNGNKNWLVLTDLRGGYCEFGTINKGRDGKFYVNVSRSVLIKEGVVEQYWEKVRKDGVGYSTEKQALDAAYLLRMDMCP